MKCSSDGWQIDVYTVRVKIVVRRVFTNLSFTVNWLCYVYRSQNRAQRILFCREINDFWQYLVCTDELWIRAWNFNVFIFFLCFFLVSLISRGCSSVCQKGFCLFSREASCTSGALKLVHIARVVKKEVAWQCLRSGRVQRHLWRVDWTFWETEVMKMMLFSKLDEIDE